MFNKEMEIGHIVAVRYCWNAYVGEINIQGLCATGAARFAFFSPHSIKDDGTYQIIGHKDSSHPDFNEEVLNYYKSETGECPVKLHIFDKLYLKAHE